jgi:hypothetical protein
MLHIHCGDSSAGTLRESGVPGEVLVWHDPVSDGPTPAGLPKDAWLDLRAEYIARWAGHATAAGIRATLARELAALEASTTEDEVVLWFDACLFDQSILIRLLKWYAVNGTPAALSLIDVGAFPGKPRFKGLGELNAEEMASLFPQRRPVTAETLALARTAWAAYCAPEPTALPPLLEADTHPLPHLRDALLRHLEQFPGRDGLDRLERETLRAVADAPLTLGPLFMAVDAQEARPYFGDTMLWLTAERLADLGVLAISGPGRLPRFDDPDPADINTWTVAITDLGRAVLAGAQDAATLRPYDRWVGGVHLTPATLWRWDGSLLPPA